MRILLTGASGFLGGHLRKRLAGDNEVVTLGRSESNDICCDLSTGIPTLPHSDMVVHAAGKAHIVPKTDEEAKAFWDVNLKGTQFLLRALEACPEKPVTIVFYSTVAVYGLEHGTDVDEGYPTLGGTPYADSKIAAETLLREWGAANDVGIVILRIPLIAGAGAPGNLAAMWKAMKRGYYLRIGDGSARKSMVNASDLANLLPSLLGREGTYNLTDGQHPSLAELDSLMARRLGREVRSISDGLASVLARAGDWIPRFPFNSYRYEKLKRHLTFSDDKARRELGWSPATVLEDFHI
jgi:nucleoside-diphosphate-sugar epimerase